MYLSSLMEGGDNGFILALYMKMNMQFLCIKIESIVSYRNAASDCFLDRFTFFILICKNSENILTHVKSPKPALSKGDFLKLH